MRGPDSLSLKFGLSTWLLRAHYSAAVLSAWAIILSSASLAWKLGIFSVLVFATFIVHAACMSELRAGIIDLQHDGSAQVTTDGHIQSLELAENAWAVRWFCVLKLVDPDCVNCRYCVVCASANEKDEYRRLLKYLNMRSPEENLQRTNWW